MLEPGERPARLQQHELSFHVGVGVRKWVLQRVAHPRLGCEVDDAVDVGMIANKAPDRPAVGDVQPLEAEPGLTRELAESGLSFRVTS
jgi:hypothetical protein